jgi:voltage-gated potassium channel
MKTKREPDAIPWNEQTPDGQVLLSMPWEIFVLGVAVLSIANLFLGLVLRNPDLDQVIWVIDLLLIVVFVIDLLQRLRIATDRRAYMVRGWGWLDAIGTIPLLRFFRLLRIIRVMRIVGRMGGLGSALKVFFANRAAGGLLFVLLLAIYVLELGSLAVLAAERSDPEANIRTASDAVWYTIVTMSTVGYGDRYPVTELGRLVGALIIVIGVGVFGTFTGFLANAFLSPSRE